jgi:hypothetical protein
VTIDQSANRSTHAHSFAEPVLPPNVAPASLGQTARTPVRTVESRPPIAASTDFETPPLLAPSSRFQSRRGGVRLWTRRRTSIRQQFDGCWTDSRSQRRKGDRLEEHRPELAPGSRRRRVDETGTARAVEIHEASRKYRANAKKLRPRRVARHGHDHIRRNTTLRLFAGISVISGAENPTDCFIAATASRSRRLQRGLRSRRL